MNRENILDAIKVMEGASNLDMRYFQEFVGPGKYVSSVEELHSCGNTACFAGYIAVSEGFKKFGGYRDMFGAPNLEGCLLSGYSRSCNAVGDYLGISYEIAFKMIYRDQHLYPVEFNEVKPHHVIEVLNKILAGELV